MKPERWQQLDQLFHSALEREREKRSAFLDQACAGDELLRRQVEALLVAHEEAASFIEKPALEMEAQSLANEQSGSAAAMIGQSISHYRIISQLGEGGMGVVYLAQDTRLGRQVALKLLPEHFTRDEERMRRFEQEARAASALNHPNIVTIHEIGQDGSYHFIAEEFIDGVTLSEYVAGKRLELYEALDIALQVTSALAAAHAKGIVHRDIKPENIMVEHGSHILGRQNHVKVLDFGIAKLTEPETATKGEATTRLLVKTDEGRAIGTAAYMSPEQARGESVDSRTDIWSLGVVLYEVLTGKQPFVGDTSQDVLASILRDDLPPLSTEFPESLKWILKKALRKDSEDRYQTARELFSDLRDLQEQVRGIQSVDLSLPPSPEVKDSGQIRVAPAQDQVKTKETPARPTSSAEYIVSEIKRLRAGSIVVFTALVIVVLGLGFGLYKFIGQKQSQTTQNQTGPAVPFQNMKIARLTSTGKAADAAISPDGKYVVHVVDEGQKQSLWMRQVSTSSNVQITPPANVSYLGMTFSPGGDYLYYNAWDKKNNPFLLYQMPVLGGTPKKLIVDIDSVVTFSPDGKQFAFVRGSPLQGEVSVLVANADGTAERKLATRGIPPGPLGPLAWSPDGKVIAWAAPSSDATGNYMTLVEVRVADGSEKMISSRRWDRVAREAWLRDGSGLVFTARESVASPSQIWYLSYPGGEAQRITNDLNDYVGLSLTADSAALVTVQTERVSNIWIAPQDNSRRATQVTFAKFDGVEGISWTPDGKIVYASSAGGNLDLWMIEANGTGQRQLTANAGNNSRPSVSADGRYVVFVSDRTGANHIWRIDIDGSNARQLTNGDGEFNAQCSPTGPWVVYQPSSGKGGLWRVPIDGGEVVQITDKASAGVAISPDGKWIATAYFVPSAIKTAIYPFEGGEPQKILDLILSFDVRWTPDGHALAYLYQSSPENISIQPVDGGPPKRLTDFTSDRIFSFAWSHDGKQLALARGTRTHDVVLISSRR